MSDAAVICSLQLNLAESEKALREALKRLLEVEKRLEVSTSSGVRLAEMAEKYRQAAETAEAERDLLLKAPGNRLEGYRELGDMCAALHCQVDELRYALERSLIWCVAAGLDGTGDCTEPAWCEQARFAIAKARGE